MSRVKRALDCFPPKAETALPDWTVHLEERELRDMETTGSRQMERKRIEGQNPRLHS